MTALDTINRLDDGLPVSPADLALLEIAEQHASDVWYRRDRLVESYRAGVCVICGAEGDGPECSSCTAGWDHLVDRAGDLSDNTTTTPLQDPQLVRR